MCSYTTYRTRYGELYSSNRRTAEILHEAKLTLVLKVKPFKFEPLFECLHTENFINVDIQIVTYLRATKTSNGSFQLEYDTSSLLLKPLSTYRIHITNKAVVGYQYQDRK